jgi:hypothetical protein
MEEETKIQLFYPKNREKIIHQFYYEANLSKNLPAYCCHFGLYTQRSSNLIKPGIFYPQNILLSHSRLE